MDYERWSQKVIFELQGDKEVEEHTFSTLQAKPRDIFKKNTNKVCRSKF